MLPERTTEQVDYLEQRYSPGSQQRPNNQYATDAYYAQPYPADEPAGYRGPLAPEQRAAPRTMAYSHTAAPYANHSRNRQPNAGQDLLIGLLGGVVGVIAMDLFSQQILPMLMQENEENGRKQTDEQTDLDEEREQPLDSLAVIGEHHRYNESSTAAVGRILYHWATDMDPDKATKTALSYLVHWGYGIAQGALYARLRGPVHGADALGGITFGGGLWFFGDELVVPMLGLQDGPTASSLSTHMNRLALHLVYGITTAATVQWLRRATT